MNNRSQSLDIFRGITICFMIIVNTAGDGSVSYPMLKHAAWHGFTPTDLVFPSFVFITGVSSWFSFQKYSHILDSKLLQKIWKRTAIIFLLGVLMYAFPFYNRPLSTWRILGVLQRIALCYGIGATLALWLNTKQIIGVSIVFLLGYWGLLLGFGDLSLEQNAVRTLDIFLFGESHLYQGQGIAFDPEGLLSTLPSIVTYLIGYLAGQYIGTTKDKALIMNTLSKVGIGLIVVGMLWHFAFPINKKLWTSSFAVLTGGLSTLIFLLCYYLVDIKKISEWGQFFKVFGTNAILAYLLSEILEISLCTFIKVQDTPDVLLDGHEAAFRYGVGLWLGHTAFASFLYAFIFMLLCWIIVYFFYKRNIFLKV
jgi:predicted acyltransferase